MAHFADRVALGVAKPAHLLQSMVGNQETLPKRLERYEETLIRETLAAHNGNVQETIEALGIPRKTFTIRCNVMASIARTIAPTAIEVHLPSVWEDHDDLETLPSSLFVVLPEGDNRLL